MCKHGLKFFKIDIGMLRFIDSFGFMSGSLADLARVHIQSGNSLKFTNAIVGILEDQTK